MTTHAFAFLRLALVVVFVLSASAARAQTDAAPASSGASVSTTTPDRPSRLRLLLGAEVALHSADMLSTVYALRLDGAREGNTLLAPLARRPAAMIAVSSAVNLLQLYTITKLSRRHPRMAVVWTAALIGLESYAVSNNLRVASQLRRSSASVH